MTQSTPLTVGELKALLTNFDDSAPVYAFDHRGETRSVHSGGVTFGEFPIYLLTTSATPYDEVVGLHIAGGE